MPLFSKKESFRNTLVLDVGTSSVNGFLVHVFENRLPEIYASSHSRLKLLESSDFRYVWRNLKKVLLEVISNLKKSTRAPNDIVISFSSPWYFSDTRVINMERQEGFVVDKEILDDLISEEVGLFMRSSKERLSSSELVILERDIMKAELNGYPVVEPLGKRTQKLAVWLYVSISRKEILEEVNDIIEHEFGKVPVKTCSSALLLFKAVKDMASPDDGFVLVDIGGEVTEVSLIRKRVIEEMTTFALGGNFILRRLASGLRVAPDEVVSLMRAKTRDGLEDSMDKKITELLGEVCKEWYQNFSKSLEEIGHDNPMPQTLILLGGTSGLPPLKKYLESEELTRFTILGRPFNILALMPEDLTGRVNFTALDKKDPQITLPLLLVIAASRYANK